MANITHDTIFNIDRIIFPPLHIKWSSIKQFSKTLDTEGQCFRHTRIVEKMKAGVLDGPQIRTLIRDNQFVAKMTALEKAAWLSFVAVVQNFL